MISEKEFKERVTKIVDFVDFEVKSLIQKNLTGNDMTQSEYNNYRLITDLDIKPTLFKQLRIVALDMIGKLPTIYLDMMREAKPNKESNN